MEPTVAVLTRIVEACGLELRMSVAGPRLPARDLGDLSVEDRLQENDRLAALYPARRAAPVAVTARQPLDDLIALKEALGRPKDLRVACAPSGTTARARLTTRWSSASCPILSRARARCACASGSPE
jgi:hypothetical protein